MKAFLLAGGVLLAAAAPAHAQHQDHGAHTATPAPAPAPVQDHSAHQMEPEQDHSAHQPQPAQDHSAHGSAGTHEMRGALGPYPMSREASGTAWQPDVSEHGGIHAMSGDWSFMGHAMLNGVYSWQEAPRGDEKAFLSGMVMGSARRDFADGNTLQLRAMLSPDPIMGKRGYPLLLAAGETADGVTPLIDRQHPHDFFMELSASYSVRLSDRASLYLYGGLPGEPAFGPPAFMHRLSIMDSPEAPITHHWLDSTHITFGVVTAGLVLDRFKLEASRFNGREPDEQRWNIETGPLDSTSIRLSWNPVRTLSLQASWADLRSPEQLEPEEDEERWSASAIHTLPLPRGWWSTTAAFARRSSDHEDLDAWLLESAVRRDAWTLFGRAEMIETNELVRIGNHHGPTFRVGKVSLGAVHDFAIAQNVKLGLGGLYALNFVPDALEPSYRGNPAGAMAFVRLKID